MTLELDAVQVLHGWQHPGSALGATVIVSASRSTIRNVATAGDGDRFQGVALVQPAEAVPESHAAAKHDRDQHDVQVIHQVSLQELVDRSGPAAEPYVQTPSRLLCLLQDLGRSAADEVEGGVADGE
jgi:hypothetical protein